MSTRGMLQRIKSPFAYHQSSPTPQRARPEMRASPLPCQVFNMWSPFAASLLPPSAVDEAAHAAAASLDAAGGDAHRTTAAVRAAEAARAAAEDTAARAAAHAAAANAANAGDANGQAAADAAEAANRAATDALAAANGALDDAIDAAANADAAYAAAEEAYESAVAAARAELEDRVDDLAAILGRVGVLCDQHDQKAFLFVLNWLSQLFQFPQHKSVMLCFLSKQGGGKGEFAKLLRALIGEAAVLTTTRPQEHVWCKFNAHLATTYLVVLNEVGKKGFEYYANEIKSLITDDTIRVEVKGGKQTQIASYHRFILTAQVKDGEAIPTEDDERRYFIVRCSDELRTGQRAHHAAFAELLKRESALRDFYRFLMSRPLASPIIGKEEIDAAMTEHHRELNATNRDAIDRFVAALAHSEEDEADGAGDDGFLFLRLPSRACAVCSVP